MPVQTTSLEVRLTDPHALVVAAAGGGVPVLEVDTLTRATKLAGRLLLNGVDVGALAHVPVTLGGGSDPALALVGQQLTLADVLTPAEHTAIGAGAPHHAAVTLGGGSDPALALVGQQLTLADVLTPAEHTAIGAGAPHHAAVTLGGGSDPALALVGQQLTLADVLTPAEHTAIGAAAPHHAQLHGAADHNAAVLAAAFNENLGAFYLDIDDIAVPANPAATVRRLFVDQATGKLSVRTNAGATVSLEEIAGVAAHNLLDGVVHLDTIAQACSRGSLIYGTSGLNWDELIVGAVGTFLRADGVDVYYGLILGADIPANHSGSAHHAQLHAAADHNAAVLTAAANENLGAFYLDIDDIAVPANPAATVRRLFVDQATGELSVRTSAGATISVEGGGTGAFAFFMGV